MRHRDLDLSQMEHIHFWGGEPLLSKEHVEFLQALPTKSKVILYYTTNGTVQPSPELLEVWTECSRVDVFCSLDDIGPRFEYTRYPANWKQTIENFQWMIDNCGENVHYGINSTINVLSQYYVDEITEWFATNFKHDKSGRQIKHDLNSTFGPMSAASAHDIVIERNIPLTSMCSHHHQTIGGVVHIGYIVGENGSVIGLSKLNRIVEHFGRRGAIQEHLVTCQIESLM